MADERKWWWTTCATGGVDYAGVGFFCGTIWEALAHADEHCSLDGTAPRARPATPTEIALYHLGPCGDSSSGGGSTGGNTGIPLLLAQDGKLLATSDGYLQAGTDDTCCCLPTARPCLLCTGGTPNAWNLHVPANTCVFPAGDYQLISLSCDACRWAYAKYDVVYGDGRTVNGTYADRPGFYTATIYFTTLALTVDNTVGPTALFLEVTHGLYRDARYDGMATLGFFYGWDRWYPAKELDTTFSAYTFPPCTTFGSVYNPGAGCPFAPGINGDPLPALDIFEPLAPCLVQPDPADFVLTSKIRYGAAGTSSFPNGLPIVSIDGQDYLQCNDVADVPLAFIDSDNSGCADEADLVPTLSAAA